MLDQRKFQWKTSIFLCRFKSRIGESARNKGSQKEENIQKEKGNGRGNSQNLGQKNAVAGRSFQTSSSEPCRESAAFFPGSSSKLTTQYLMQDHMATHHRKLLSAKAAVDSSAPRSLHTSIKYKDQLRKGKLINAVKTYKKEVFRLCSESLCNSQSVSPKPSKEYMTRKCPLPVSQYAVELPRSTGHLRSPGHPQLPLPVLLAQEAFEDIVQHVGRESCDCRPNPVRQKTSQVGREAHPISMKNVFQDPLKKTYSGDILHKHSDCFTSPSEPFVPRILKTQRKSYLSTYKYYTPPRQKKSASPGSSRLASAQAYSRGQTDLTRHSKGGHWSRNVDDSSQPPIKENKVSLAEFGTSNSLHSALLEKEEELKYLQFLQDVTNDILMKGCFHNQAFHSVFQTHIRIRRSDLDEVKMKKVLEQLKDELTISSRDEDGSQLCWFAARRL
ncbi:LOW QUALITY PROTEIN: spermatogenesis-associated protein 7 homolog [Tachyglossus aculeatus]|uniref:LOW QUALITY PROTEIN: spermatogenesis-associated protein 7 homolog n=1 Tax=Tachyglossus aculeatus TaxID=9261 RepID=UPI0018F69319|nr:LOW QUALITY PROTEIN: spermatogenesis-associated protein 7 homolog [Tachyglossus aculeatus]